jgi:hypothetical protein
MNKFEKKLRMLGFILLIILAAVGASMGGGIPVLPTKKDDNNEIKIELVESENNDNEKEESEVIQ